MFEVNTSRQTDAHRIGRITAGLACFLVMFSVLSLVSVAGADDVAPEAPGAEDPGTEDPGMGDPGTSELPFITIDYFAEQWLGDDEWLVEGIVAAGDMSAVTIQFGGLASGTVAPDAVGYFSTVTIARPGDTITADATDGNDTSHAEIFITATVFPETL